jgi:hypothetical protein
MKTIIAAIVFFSLFIGPVFAVNTYDCLDDTSHYAQQLLKLINNYRESNQLKPLCFDRTLLAGIEQKGGKFQMLVPNVQAMTCGNKRKRNTMRKTRAC